MPTPLRTEAEITESNRRWVEQWKTAGPLLEEQRERDIRATDTARDVWLFNLSSRYAREVSPPGQTSGLIDLHRWLHRDAAQRGDEL